jgi:hypothetical protein
MGRTVIVNLAAVFTIGLVLAGDSVGTRLEQGWLGAAVTAILLLQLRWADAEERSIVLWCVAISTAMELFCTQIWHLYGYRFGNLPLYVPPGHGLLCLAALWTAKSPAMTRHRRVWVGLVLGLALAWAALGLTIGERLDVEGALYLVFWLPMVFFTRRSLEWCWTFVLASLVELCGTWFGTWEWASVQPWLGFSCANPPSAAAGGYCVFTFLALGCVQLMRNRDWALMLSSGRRPAEDRR